MKIYSLCLFLICGASVLFGQTTIPPDRIISWKPGVQNGIPELKSPSSPLLLKESDQDPAAVIQKAINSIKVPGVVLLPSGTFNLKKQIVMKSGVVLRGMGSDKTRLIFNIPKNKYSGAIKIRGRMDAFVDLVDPVQAGSKSITLPTPGKFKKGSLVVLSKDNDPELMYTNKRWNVSWAKRSVGQIMSITAVSGKTFTVDTPVRLEYPAKSKARLELIRPIMNCGIENLSIKRLDKAEDSNISISEAVNCWVKNIESDYCMRGHLWMSRSRFITVTGSYFHHAHNYGGGGHGYGVVGGKHVTDTLITNNIFRHLRHSMMVKEGANGNVFSYNYSFELANLNMCDISVHGHYSYMNLFEGNIVQYVQFADYWGPTGPLTTAFRNRIVQRMNVKDHSHRTNIIANTFMGLGYLVAQDCKAPLILGNINRLNPKDLKKRFPEIPPSLYLKEKPEFWGDLPWPCIGADVDTGKHLIDIPAKTRYSKMKTDK